MGPSEDVLSLLSEIRDLQRELLAQAVVKRERWEQIHAESLEKWSNYNDEIKRASLEYEAASGFGRLKQHPPAGVWCWRS